jgi:hypothetical protein
VLFRFFDISRRASRVAACAPTLREEAREQAREQRRLERRTR